MTLFSIYIVVVQQSLLQVYTEQPFFVLFDGLCLSVGAILAGDDQAWHSCDGRFPILI